MCELVTASLALAGGVASAWGAYQKGVTTQAYNNAQAAINEAQADRILATSEINRHMVQDTAKEQGKILTTSHSKALSTQKAAFAAAGLGSGSVTAETLAMSSYDKAKMDENALRYNADMESWAIQTEAEDSAAALRSEAVMNRQAGKNARKAGMINAFSSLLGSASQFSSNFLPQRGLTYYGNFTTSYGVNVPSIYKPLK